MKENKTTISIFKIAKAFEFFFNGLNKTQLKELDKELACMFRTRIRKKKLKNSVSIN